MLDLTLYARDAVSVLKRKTGFGTKRTVEIGRRPRMLLAGIQRLSADR